MQRDRLHICMRSVWLPIEQFTTDIMAHEYTLKGYMPKLLCGRIFWSVLIHTIPVHEDLYIMWTLLQNSLFSQGKKRIMHCLMSIMSARLWRYITMVFNSCFGPKILFTLVWWNIWHTTQIFTIAHSSSYLRKIG